MSYPFSPRAADGTAIHRLFLKRPRKRLILGAALTGPKNTPKNHADRGDRIFDAISRGDMIPCSADKIALELKVLYHLGMRYGHYHARNPETREQTSSIDAYCHFGKLFRTLCPDAVLSYGGSRNGPEILSAIDAGGEWARLAHAGLPIAEGGAEFVTAQAAVELKIPIDMERQGFICFSEGKEKAKILKDLRTYTPSLESTTIDLTVFSTSGGANYGHSSAEVQLATINRCIVERHRLRLPFEVEWTQLGRSALLTRYLCTVLKLGHRLIRRLNITVLFGFSPALPFPASYKEFKRAIDTARSIATVKWTRGGGPNSQVKVSVTCGAAVLPQHATRHIREVDVGPLAGTVVGPLERLIAYACHPDSGVDVLRFGMEDTPFILDCGGVVLPATNLLLAERAVQQIYLNEGEIVTDPHLLRLFADVPREEEYPKQKRAAKL